jgi:hypothetical protein
MREFIQCLIRLDAVLLLQLHRHMGCTCSLYTAVHALDTKGT